MNIKEAKEQIKEAVSAYLTKNEFGDMEIPVERQRPTFLIGPPGIGKTAIMEQIAQELGIGLVSYSMTHHTRQSALGLPFIVTKTYGGREYSVSEYTMSEIIASVYDTIENTGYKEGILFLDEINCVSETLAPSMLQFLQYKVFGRHRVPDGWIVVTAGNPPEYNNSVREFDIVTWDRLKKMQIEPDFDVWKEYAYNRNVHPAILTYLEIKKNDFYVVETSVDGKTFVTARGWVDLSDMIKLYERKGFIVSETLVEQYLQNRRIAKEFAVYYDLFNKYRSDYQIDKILAGTNSVKIVQRAKDARFDERISLLGLILDALNEGFIEVSNTEKMMTMLMTDIKQKKTELQNTDCENAKSILGKMISAAESKISKGKAANAISDTNIRVIKKEIKVLEGMLSALGENDGVSSDKNTFDLINKLFKEENRKYKELAEETGKQLSNAFKFFEEAFEDGQELVIFVTELTANSYSASFISKYGSPDYFRHNKELLFYERQKEIIQELEQISL